MIGDAYQLADSLGNVFWLTGDYHVTAPGNFGAPPVQYRTQTNFQQHGAIVLGHVVQPRIISIDVYQEQEPGGTPWWVNRAALLNFIQPNRGVLTFTVTREDASKRALYVRPDSGLVFEPQSREDGEVLNIDQTIALIAHDPIWFDPVAVSNSPTATADDNLVFPITFGIEFGNEGNLYDSGDLLYKGSWIVYPTLTLEGPYTAAVIKNTATNVQIDLVQSITGGQFRIIRFDQETGGIIIEDSGGVQKFDELGVDSNLLDFTIRPSSEIGAVEQKITATLIGSTSGVSKFTVAYNARYYGI